MAKTKKRVKYHTARNPEEIAEILGLDRSVAIEWQVRHEITNRIIGVFESSNLTITELAKRAETSRARITRILKGDTSDISLDVLFRVLGALGQQVKLNFSKVG